MATGFSPTICCAMSTASCQLEAPLPSPGLCDVYGIKSSLPCQVFKPGPNLILQFDFLMSPPPSTKSPWPLPKPPLVISCVFPVSDFHTNCSPLWCCLLSVNQGSASFWSQLKSHPPTFSNDISKNVKPPWRGMFSSLLFTDVFPQSLAHCCKMNKKLSLLLTSPSYHWPTWGHLSLLMTWT